MRRGEVWWADLAPRSGSEQRGARPVVVVSHDAFNAAPGWKSVIVVPVSTSASQARRRATVVPIPKGAASLHEGSVALCHQVTTLDRAKLTKVLGSLPPVTMADVEEALKAAMDLP